MANDGGAAGVEGGSNPLDLAPVATSKAAKLNVFIFFDAMRVKIRDEGLVKNKAVYVALALNSDGEKSVLGLWIEQAEGAKFWLKVVNELKARGVNDILIAVVDGLKGFPEAITSVFPANRRADLHRAPDQEQLVRLYRGKIARRSCPQSRRSTGPRTPTWRW